MSEYAHVFTLRPRYAETDQMGFVYYGRFAEYYEVGRVETMRSLGLNYSDLEKVDKVIMPVMSLQVRYLRPAYYDQMLSVKTIIKQMPSDTITFFTEIRNESGQLLNGATIKLCFLDAETRKRVPCPLIIKEALSHVFQDTYSK
jgi:acyl-CoA thioester hydrolase